MRLKTISKVVAVALLVFSAAFCTSKSSSNSELLSLFGLTSLSQDQGSQGQLNLNLKTQQLSESNTVSALTKVDGSSIKRIDVNVIETQIIDFEDTIKTVSSEPIQMNLLEIAENNPVALAHAAVGAGTYKQIRLILDDSSTVTLNDDSVHPLTVPSGEQTGIKIDGIFTIPEGQFYTLDIIVDPGHSVHYAPGNGYMLKPVLELRGADVLYGNFAYKGQAGSEDFVYNLKSDGTFALILAKHPDLLVSGIFKYDGILKKFTLKILRQACSTCSPAFDTDVEKEIPDANNEVVYSVDSWGAEYIALTSETGGKLTLNSISEFNLASVRKTVIVNATINVEDTAYEDKYIAGILYPDEENGEAPMMVGQIIGGKTSLNFHLSESEIPATGDRKYRMTLVVVNSLEDIQFDSNGIQSVDNVIKSKSGKLTVFPVTRQDSPVYQTIDF